FGTISTGYKSHGAMLDPLYRTALQGRNYGMQSPLHSNAGEDGQGRADNTVRWDSPSWNGVKVMAHYTLDSDERDGTGIVAGTCTAPAANPRCREDDDAFGIGAQYSNGGILVFADWLTNNSNDDTNTGGDLTAWKVGGKYTINNFAVMGQYEDIEDNVTAFGANGKQEGTLWHLGASYTMGNNMLYAAYGSGSASDLLNDTVPNDDSDQTAYTIAATHQLSKRTMVYAGYNHMEQDNDSGLNGALTGAVAGGYAGTVDDPEQDTIAIGMKHKF
ncbi:MAG: porin, partial [Gammaproteobacteria bacterium]